MSEPDDRRALWLRGVLDLCVLAALTERERYGYELSQRLEAGGLGRIKGGTLYPLLARLEEAGLVTFRWEPGEQGPGRKYYRLTAAGRAHLAAQAGAWSEFTKDVTALLTSTPGGQHEPSGISTGAPPAAVVSGSAQGTSRRHRDRGR